ncbi:MAG: fasciclin [Oscillatoriales cyanobacterium CG2_30_44_21]|nr:MAG: fasciclin [Oscillatoriales cyanobacterium CG2_30_44_21]
MKIPKTTGLIIKTASMAIATASLIVGLPALANNHSAPTAPKKTSMVKAGNIVQVAVGNGSFNTLVAAVKAAGLVEVLSGKGPFTVFAPTDAAFAKLPEGQIAELLKPENKATLVKILTYHVVAGKVEAKNIKAGSALVKTVEGNVIKVTKSNKGVVIDNSKVVAADVKASNGVIHVIDTVLMPPDL